MLNRRTKMKIRDVKFLRIGTIGFLCFVVYYGFLALYYHKDLDTEKVKIYNLDKNVWKPNTEVCRKDVISRKTKKHDFFLQTLETRFGKLKIYTNDPDEDMVSKRIRKNGTFEPFVFNTIYKIIRSDQDIGILDVGANIGVMAIQLANIGRKVIALEATRQCVEHLCANIVANGLEDKVTVVYNALSNNHDDVPFVLPKKGQYTLGFVEQGNIRKDMVGYYHNNELYSKHTINLTSATLDDVMLLPQFQEFKNVFIKMDIQGFEHKAIEGAGRFFQQSKIVGLYVEWFWHRKRQTGEYLKKKFAEWKYDPFYCNAALKDTFVDIERSCIKVNYKDSDTWGSDILWLPRK